VISLRAMFVDPFVHPDPIRQAEVASILLFMQRHRHYLKGRVLDFGAGREPYRDLVEGGYVPFEKGDAWLGGAFDAVMCNQVLQYVDSPEKELLRFAACLKPGGHLVMTYPANWDEVEETDLRRFTQAGMTKLLEDAGFRILTHERRAEVAIAHFKFALGYGVVCQK
jgi:SAM-dependent methyltransferase